MRQSVSTLTGDQRLKSEFDKRRFFMDAGKSGRLRQEFIVNVESGSHMHQYALFVHIKSRVGNFHTTGTSRRQLRAF